MGKGEHVVEGLKCSLLGTDYSRLAAGRARNFYDVGAAVEVLRTRPREFKLPSNVGRFAARARHQMLCSHRGHLAPDVFIIGGQTGPRPFGTWKKMVDRDAESASHVGMRLQSSDYKLFRALLIRLRILGVPGICLYTNISKIHSRKRYGLTTV
jgi:hypothetical protein